ncbi:autotransporter outer membrane beta-barrel domain-containing protein [Pseudooceanicola algae]|uniref:Uncharacterized protein n=1 Tax=Pseudooceanicola algae TaxID=1537215 RepID=A0A418SHH9_9RHOB|nr:autotransporter outer membrane beta-barrel domain-containing protein [Pseudooceanicola algae]QPM90508.1 hypothetical protein PSAL_017470 [Pseudooceanicola algae]
MKPKSLLAQLALSTALTSALLGTNAHADGQTTVGQTYAGQNQHLSFDISSSSYHFIWSTISQSIDGWDPRSFSLTGSTVGLALNSGTTLQSGRSFGFNAIGIYNTQQYYGNVDIQPVTVDLTDTDVDVSVASGATVDNPVIGLYVESRALHGVDSGGAASPSGVHNVTLSGATVTVRADPSASYKAGGAAVYLDQHPEAGGAGHDDKNTNGGYGSLARTVNVAIGNSVLTTEGRDIAGLFVNQRGGIGGPGHDGDSSVKGGTGGSTEGVNIRFSGGGNSISTTGDASDGVSVISSAGNGGKGSDDGGAFSFSPDGGDGGNGGDAGLLSFTSDGVLNIATAGENAAGIEMIGLGGSGGQGGDIEDISFGDAGQAGIGGKGAKVQIQLGADTRVQTGGPEANGIHVESIGGDGGVGGKEQTDISDAETPDGGRAGAGGDMNLNAAPDSSVTTQGENSHGILARSIGGTGGASGPAAGGFGEGHAGRGGEGGAGGAVTITSSGEIRTYGLDARGILAQSLGGTGGRGADANGVLAAEGGTGYKGGNAGNVVVTQGAGSITTSGDNAQGILAQSIAGGGGAGGRGDGSLFSASGGDGAEPSNAGTVAVTNNGLITTDGETSFGLVAQSIGGGGGVGGTGSGVFVSSGGDGGVGGDGNTARADLAYQITTNGQMAHGAIVQSIGGGGGAGGNSLAGGAFTALAIGGTGGDGGNGALAEARMDDGKISTQGGGANGLVVQSVGGGGGAGGTAYATSVGIIVAEAAAIGGSGGNGGDGHTATATLDNGSVIRTSGAGVSDVDNHGLLVQSIGGGGGVGGGADAFAMAVALPIGKEDGAASTPTITIDAAVGGSGGNGGDALISENQSASASAHVRGGSSVSTSGDGSQGVMVQSIGGGGGSGGDSSAAYASVGMGASRIPGTPSPVNVNLSLAVGGKCTESASDPSCSGGSGSKAEFILGDDNSLPSLVSTTGNLSNGVVIQSIGGGGGNAGLGSTASSNYFSGPKQQIKITLGSVGGAGGNGDEATATIAENGMVQTSGSNSRGLVVQSIGGGGGIASGGGVTRIGALDKDVSFSVPSGQSFVHTIDTEMSLKIGSDGGTGGNAGLAKVVHMGTIQTLGAGSTGILVQSIGGGGGIGGAAGEPADPSDEVIDDFTDLFNEIYAETVPAESSTLLVLAAEGDGDAPEPIKSGKLSINASVNIGGTGGSGGHGGQVDATQSGVIVTYGDLSFGLKAQSVGGGGGTGGTAVAEATPNTLRSYFKSYNIKTNLSLGFEGNGGPGASGGAVNVTLGEGLISTGLTDGSSGFGAIGILAQSVGGGGGTAGDNTVAPDGVQSDDADPDEDLSVDLTPPSLTLGANVSVAGTDTFAGAGGVVTLASAAGETGTQTVITQGEQAHGVVLQSIGGGGGIITRGGSVDLGYDDSVLNPTAYVSLGSRSSNAQIEGGLIDTAGLTAATPLEILTNGTGAFGMLAQSVGGGGGILSASHGMTTQSFQMGTSGFGNGGAVNLVLPTGSTITTTGKAAHGIVAQSIGGGGGIFTTYHDSAPSVSNITTRFADTGGTSIDSSGAGQDVTIESAADIHVSGEGAMGIIAQSVGGGGGLAALRDGTLFLGTSSTASNTDGYGGKVTLRLTGDVIASGSGGTGIIAQSAGVTGRQIVSITLGSEDGTEVSTVSGGTGDDAWGIRLLGGIEDAQYHNQLTIHAGSLVSAVSGQAILQSDGNLDVFNSGEIRGTVQLGTGVVSGTPAVASPAPTPLAFAASVPSYGTLYNSGTLGSLPGTEAVIGGHLVQDGDGVMAPVVNFATGAVGGFRVLGDAQLDGTVVPQLAGIIPGVSIGFLTVEGSTSGALGGGRSALFGYDVEIRNGSHMLSVSGRDFDAAEFGLSTAAAETARELEYVFDSGQTELAGYFATLDQVATIDPAAFDTALGQISPHPVMGLMAHRASEASRIADAAMSCPVFERGDAFLSEDSCVYGRLGASRSEQDSDGDTDSRYGDTTWLIGQQTEISPDVFLGGTLSYSDTWMSNDTGVSADGYGVAAAVTLKHETGPWLLTGAVFGNLGQDDVERRVDMGTFSGTGTGSVTSRSLGLRARVAYTIGSERSYLRPSMNLDGIIARSEAWKEDGMGAIGLDYDATEHRTAILTPALEFGGRTELREDLSLRSFVSAGVILRSNDTWNATAHLRGAGGSDGIDVSLPQDSTALQLRAGVQLYNKDGLDLRVEYTGSFGETSTSHSGLLNVSYRF